MPSDKLIAITGANGSLGSVILEQLIQGGYNVNVILRSFAKSKAFIENTYPDAASNGQLKFTEIVDMASPGAFDEVLATADELLHIATPIANGNYEETMLKPGEAIMNNVLNASKNSPRMRRVIITGSVVSTLRVPDDLFSGRTISAKDFNSITREEASTSTLAAYQYSKVAAEQQAWAFVEREKPGFDLIFHLTPSITGRSIYQNWRSDKNELGGMADIYRSLFDVEKPTPLFSYFMDIDDVAAMHVRSLDIDTVPGNTRYLAAAGIIDAGEMARKIREKFPELRNRVPDASESSNAPPGLIKLDLEATEKVFGNEWKSAWETTKATVKDILTSESKYGVPQLTGQAERYA